jgi:hypothetical protein
MSKSFRLKAAFMLVAIVALVVLIGLLVVVSSPNVTPEGIARILPVLLGHLLGVFVIIEILLVKTLPKE